MIFPVKRVKEALINEFAVSNMDIETFSEMHNIQSDGNGKVNKSAVPKYPESCNLSSRFY